MVRGGRTFTRGRGGGSSYRGNSTGGYRGNPRNFNSDFQSSRGGGNGPSRYNNGGSSGYDNSYDSRNTSGYQGSSPYQGNRLDSYNKRPYASSRDRSPVDRKRSRIEGSRRGRDYGNPAGDYGNNSSRYEGNSYNRRVEPRSRAMSPPRQSFRARDSSSSSQRSRERMGPPKGLPPRRTRGGSSAIGTSYRGRGASSIRGGNIRRARVGVVRNTDIRGRRPIVSQKTSDKVRKAKIARLRSTIKKRSAADKGDDESDDSTSKTEENGDDEEKADDDGEEKSDSTETTPKKKSAAATKKTPTKASDEASGDELELEDKGDVDDADNGSEAADPEEEDVQEDDADANDVAAESDEEERYKPKHGRKEYIKLTCVHCHSKCVTFKAYGSHLFSPYHKQAMRRVANRQKAQLSAMRQSQRNSQRELEEKQENTEEIESQFCLLCRLNYRSEKKDHQASESHRKMKRFLMPYCSCCDISFKSPMVYEMHRCQLDHIKNKAKLESKTKKHDIDLDSEREVDLEEFMTVDSIGDVDGHNGDEDDGVNEKKDGSVETKPKTEIVVGKEHMKKVDVYYCELCRYYLPHKDEQEAALKKHCGTRSHLRSYLRFKENQDLRLAAEKIHRKHQEQRDAKRAKIENDNEIKKENAEGKDAEDETEDPTHDKIWADVDKDLGELLQEVGTENANDDEDEDSTTTTERYDRFKNSGKDADGEKKVGDNEKTVESVTPTESASVKISEEVIETPTK